jgi:hypothetical protein
MTSYIKQLRSGHVVWEKTTHRFPGKADLHDGTPA